MIPDREDGIERDRHLGEVLGAYFVSAEAREVAERAALLARPPDLADDLRAFFGARERLDRLAAPLRGVIQEASAVRPPNGQAPPLLPPENTSRSAAEDQPNDGPSELSTLGPRTRELGDYE